LCNARGRLWPEPEATPAAAGVPCLGSTCRRGVGPNSPLVTRSRQRSEFFALRNSYSITSSARSRNESGIPMPIAPSRRQRPPMRRDPCNAFPSNFCATVIALRGRLAGAGSADGCGACISELNRRASRHGFWEAGGDRGRTYYHGPGDAHQRYAGRAVIVDEGSARFTRINPRTVKRLEQVQDLPRRWLRWNQLASKSFADPGANGPVVKTVRKIVSSVIVASQSSRRGRR
jgi:hypothetical protein